MKKRVLGVALFAAMSLASSCSTIDAYPAEWHASNTSIHVYGPSLANAVEVLATGEITVFDLVLGHRQPGSDLSRVVVCRRSGADLLRLNVDVLAMIRTGVTTSNILLRPGDVVQIPG